MKFIKLMDPLKCYKIIELTGSVIEPIRDPDRPNDVFLTVTRGEEQTVLFYIHATSLAGAGSNPMDKASEFIEKFADVLYEHPSDHELIDLIVDSDTSTVKIDHIFTWGTIVDFPSYKIGFENWL